MSEVDEVLEDIIKYRVKEPEFKSKLVLDSVVTLKLVETLRATQCVTQLWLADAKIEAGSFRSIFEFLKQRDCVIRRATFCNCNLQADDAPCLAEALKVNTTLRALSLDRNKLNDEGVMCLALAFEQNKVLEKLRISANNCGIDAVGSVLHHGKRLKNLNAKANFKVWKHKDISVLEDPLKEHNCLEKLNLSLNGIDIQGARSLARALKVNSSIKTLILIENNMAEGGGVALCQALRTNRTLTCLELGFNKLGTADALAFADILPDSSLIQLNLDSSSFQLEGVTAISEALLASKSLKSLELYSVDGLNGSIHFGSLTSLDLSDNSLGPDAGRLLGESLKHNRLLRVLYLWSIMPTEEDVRYLFEGVKVNDTLLELHLSDNELDSSCARLIGQGLIENKSISKLFIGNNSFGPDAARYLVEMLQLNKTLRKLDVSRNAFGSEGGCLIFDALKDNYTLETLDIGNNNLDLAAAKSFSELLKVNCTLTEVDIEDRFCKEALALIAEAIRINQGLSLFSMGYVKYDEVIYDAICSNENILGFDSEDSCIRNKYKRLARIETSIVTFLCIRKFRMTILNQHPKEILVMIAAMILKTTEDPKCWRQLKG